jgi:hypothetical protein
MRSFFLNKAQEFQRYAQESAIVLEEGGLGQRNIKGLIDRISKLAKLGGTALTVTQVGFEYAKGDYEKLEREAAGALAGMAAAAIGGARGGEYLDRLYLGSQVV